MKRKVKKMTTESKKAESKKAKSSDESFDPKRWNGVEMKEGSYYYVLRSRSEIPGITALDVAENPLEVVEAKYLGYSQKEYMFDDGRLTPEKGMVWLAVAVEDREDYIYLNNPDGKKAALAYVKEAHDYNMALIRAARDKDDQIALNAAKHAESLADLEVMVLALGGDEKILRKAGKSRQKKIDAIMRLRPVYFEKKKAGPIPERQSSKDVVKK